MEWKFKGDRIRTARETRDITQAELARMLDISPQQLSQWEGEKVTPGQDNLVRICNVLQCPPKFFFVNSREC